ncbi:MAG: glycosyltransferase [Acidobacteriota bacterium]
MDALHVATARCCVAPLRDYRVAAGQNSVFEIMALGRTLVIADCIALRSTSPRSGALFYPPGDAAALVTRSRFFLDAPAAAGDFGQRARLSPQAWLSRQAERFLQVLPLPRDSMAGQEQSKITFM